MHHEIGISAIKFNYITPIQVLKKTLFVELTSTLLFRFKHIDIPHYQISKVVDLTVATS
jgi:hypothetical protein